MTVLYTIEPSHLAALRALRTRLHSEIRMDGDAMRDAGHTLDAIIRFAEQMPMPIGEKKP